MRLFVLTAFGLTVWLFGPRAVDVLAARYQQATEQSPLVDLDRVGFLAEPEWLRGDELLTVAVAKDLGPQLQERIPILDEVAAREVRDRLGQSPWVRAVSLQRDFPDSFRVELDLRRPVLAVRSGEDEPLCLVDRNGTALPWVDVALPVVRLHRDGGSPTMRFQHGQLVPDQRVLAAASIAVEWRDELAPLVPECPRLVEVDTTNLDERWLSGRCYPEVRVHVAREDGEPVILCYGRPVETTLPRVSVKTKAYVLTQILTKAPGLRGLIAGELRLKNRWADYLQPRDRGVPDPDGPWPMLEQGMRPRRGR